MKNKILLVIIIVLMSAINACLAAGTGEFTQVTPTVRIYSEYYPNENGAFKGTIIFENGMGCDIDEWKYTPDKQLSLMDYAKSLGSVFAYDRPGEETGSPPDYSISITNPITAEYVADNLMQLLKQRNVKPPYILVGHSYGGLFAQYFARKYPEIVAGVLYVDASTQGQAFSLNSMTEYLEMAKTHNSEYMYKNYPQIAVSLYMLSGYLLSVQQIDSLPPISPKIPVIVLEASDDSLYLPEWHKNHQMLAAQSLNGKLIVVDSGHFIMFDDPALCREQLRELIQRVK